MLCALPQFNAKVIITGIEYLLDVQCYDSLLILNLNNCFLFTPFLQ